jgi:hypothetical protein
MKYPFSFKGIFLAYKRTHELGRLMAHAADLQFQIRQHQELARTDHSLTLASKIEALNFDLKTTTDSISELRKIVND